MNVSMPAEIRQLVKQGAISTAALERDTLDDSAWIVRAVCEKLVREWDHLDLSGPMPELVRLLGSRPLRRIPALPDLAARALGALSIAG